MSYIVPYKLYIYKLNLIKNKIYFIPMSILLSWGVGPGKWPPFLARQNFFENCHGYSADITCGSKISSKSLYLAGFSRYKHFYVLQFLRKIRKFKMAAIFGETKIF